MSETLHTSAEENNTSEQTLHPEVRGWLEDEMSQILDECYRSAPRFLAPGALSGEGRKVRIPVISEIIKDAPQSGVHTFLELEEEDKGARYKLTYLRREELYDTEKDKSVVNEEQSLQLRFDGEIDSVPVLLLDHELKNPDLKSAELDNRLAIEVYSDLKDVHELIRPIPDQPDLRALPLAS